MWLPTLLESQFRECADVIVYFIYFIFCMRLISLHYQENCVWPSLKCHARLHPLIRRERVSLPRALHGFWGGDE